MASGSTSDSCCFGRKNSNHARSHTHACSKRENMVKIHIPFSIYLQVIQCIPRNACDIEIVGDWCLAPLLTINLNIAKMICLLLSFINLNYQGLPSQYPMYDAYRIFNYFQYSSVVIHILRILWKWIRQPRIFFFLSDQHFQFRMQERNSSNLLFANQWLVTLSS